MLLVAAAPAEAHGALGNALPFWSGALHLFLAPMALLVVVGLAAAIAPASVDELPWLLGAVGASSFLASSLLPEGLVLLVHAGGFAVGSSAALGLKPGRYLAVVLGAAGGLASGAAIEFDERSMGAATGAAFSTMLAVAYTGMGLSWIAKRWPIALRVLGAWVAAISLLLAALALATHRL